MTNKHNQHTKTEHGITVTVHRATGLDRMTRLAVARKVNPVLQSYGDVADISLLFGRIVSQVDKVKGLDWKVPSPLATAEQLQAACMALLAFDERVLDLFETVLTEVETPLNDSDLLPADEVAPDVLSNPLSANGDGSSEAILTPLALP